MLSSILPWISHCAVCGAVWPPIHFLCKGCRTKLLGRRTELQCLSQNAYSFPVLSLWHWKVGDRFLGALIYSLKGERANRIAARNYLLELAGDLALKAGHRNKLKGEWVIVPAPPKQIGAEDHALTLAQALAETLGFKVLRVLQRADESAAQKKLSRSQRGRRKLKCLQGVNLRRAQVLFVDDIITSGSTAEAAYKALGSPRGFQVWALAERSLLL